MRKVIFLLIAAFVLILPVLVFAQSDKEVEQAKSWLGQWKRNYASPTYGMTFFHGNLEVNGYLPNRISDNKGEFSITAVDLRIFRGVNVSKRGGFYTGVETGVLFLAPFEETSFFEPNLGEKMYLDYTGGLVFLMAKYGLRIDLGISLFGVSLGAEVGMGGTLFSGGFDFYTGSSDNRTADVGFGTDRAAMGLILDTALEGAIRIGKNFRIVAKAGILAAPIPMPRSDEKDNYWFDEQGNAHYTWDTNDSNAITLGSEEYKRAVMSQYGINIDPFAIDVRIGFVLNFQ